MLCNNEIQPFAAQVDTNMPTPKILDHKRPHCAYNSRYDPIVTF